MNLSDKLKHNFSSEPWFKPEKNILLAVSGGEDSMALLHICSKLNLTFSVAHYCFGLRPEENKQEINLISETCKKLKIPCFIHNIAEHHLLQLKEGNLQEKARDLRYNWFKELKNQFGFDYLFTAHHANDQAETLLFNLSRGTGIKGLGGMKLMNDWHIRPLLFIPKSEISTFVQQENITFCSDSSNQTLNYSRNKLRQQVVKPFQNAFPNAIAAMGSTAELMQETEQLLSALVDDFFLKHGQKLCDHYIIQTAALLDFKESKSLLFQFIKKLGFNLVQTENILEAIFLKRENAMVENHSFEIIYSRAHLYIMPKSSIEESIDIATLNQVYSFNGQTIRFSVEPNHAQINLKDGIIYLDADKIKLPLQLRLVRAGDSFKPFGSKGTKLVSDIINEKKLNPIQKKSVFILLNHNDIVAALPICPADGVRVKAQTQIVLAIQYQKAGLE